MLKYDSIFIYQLPCEEANKDLNILHKITNQQPVRQEIDALAEMTLLS